MIGSDDDDDDVNHLFTYAKFLILIFKVKRSILIRYPPAFHPQYGCFCCQYQNIQQLNFIEVMDSKNLKSKN
jgi:hypothetical protein